MFTRKTDDPVRDAERASQDPRPVIGYCCFCGGEIRGESGILGCDPHYSLPGFGFIEWECLRAWARPFLRGG